MRIEDLEGQLRRYEENSVNLYKNKEYVIEIRFKNNVKNNNL